VSFFCDPTPRYKSWQRWQVGYLNTCIWVGVLSAGALCIPRIKMRYPVAGLVCAAGLYALSERAASYADEGACLVEASGLVKDEGALAEKLSGLRGRIEKLQEERSSLWFASESAFAPLRDSLVKRDRQWTCHCSDLAQFTHLVGRCSEIHPIFAAALLRSIERMVNASEAVDRDPKEGERWDQFLRRKLELALRLSFIYYRDVPLEEVHPKEAELASWNNVQVDVDFHYNNGEEKRRALIEIYQQRFHQLYLGELPLP